MNCQVKIAKKGNMRTIGTANHVICKSWQSGHHDIGFLCFSFGNDAAWKVRIDEARKLVTKAIDLGINFFDTVNVYSQGGRMK
jgi:aryl-alcohol dehydrogenase-like predicted oxidoreductase